MKIPYFRWWIIALVFLAAVLNYVDRQTLSILAPTIQSDLGMDERDYANIINIFLVAYTISYLISGRMIDKLGTRMGMGIFVAFWSVANMLTAFAHGMRSMSAFRLSLGLGEAGVWPAASKSVSEWFPARERALAIGIYTMGSTIGATVAPWLVINISEFSYETHLPVVSAVLGDGAGWRMAFLLTGMFGLLWLIPWFLLYRSPRKSPFVSQKELALIENSDATGEREAPPGDEQRVSDENLQTRAWTWKQVFSSRIVWALLLGRLLTDPVWYFFQFWFPKYLHAERGLAQSDLTITWIIYLAAGVGSLGGGIVSGMLIKRGILPAASRLWTMLGCALLMPLSPLIASVSGLPLTMVFASVSVIATLAFLINISSLVVDVVPKHSLGTVFSVVAAGSTLGGIIMNAIVARMVSGDPTGTPGFLDRLVETVFGPLFNLISGTGYASWFIIMAFLHILAVAIIYFARIHKIQAN